MCAATVPFVQLDSDLQPCTCTLGSTPSSPLLSSPNCYVSTLGTPSCLLAPGAPPRLLCGHLSRCLASLQVSMAGGGAAGDRDLRTKHVTHARAAARCARRGDRCCALGMADRRLLAADTLQMQRRGRQLEGAQQKSTKWHRGPMQLGTQACVWPRRGCQGALQGARENHGGRARRWCPPNEAGEREGAKEVTGRALMLGRRLAEGNRKRTDGRGDTWGMKSIGRRAGASLDRARRARRGRFLGPGNRRAAGRPRRANVLLLPAGVMTAGAGTRLSRHAPGWGLGASNEVAR